MPLRTAWDESLRRLACPAARPDPALILLGMTLPIGDTLFCQPAVAGLRRRFPQARLMALVWSTNAPLAEANHDIDDLIVYDNEDRAHSFIDRLDGVLHAIRRRHPQQAINFTSSSSLVTMLAGLPRRTGQHLPFGFWLWGSAFAPEYHARHAVDQYWDVVRPLGALPRNVVDRVPQWQVAPEEALAARERLAALGIVHDDTRPVVMVHPGAAGFGGRKRWPAEYFGQVAARLSAAMGARVVVLGGRQDVALAETIVRTAGRHTLSLAAQLDVRASIAMLTQADCFIANDTGLMHFAVALGIPTVALYGVADLQQFAPRSLTPARVRVLLPHPIPAPTGFFVGNEGLFSPRHPPDDRMERISVDRVVAAATALLAAPVRVRS
jgi:lipopolysaccharide heptosyltransferase II